MASAIERATGPESERTELRSERTAATKERPESGRRGLSSSALSPPAKPLGEIALQVSKLVEFTGRTEPSVIT